MPASIRYTEVKRCAFCGERIESGKAEESLLFEDTCGPCGREYACDNPDALGPDA
jgi:hypothetical protein